VGQNREKKKSCDEADWKNKNKKIAVATAARIATATVVARVAAVVVAACPAVAAAVLLRPTQLNDQEDSGTLLSYTTFRCRSNNQLLSHTLPVP
jgi:hypothetical protein